MLEPDKILQDNPGSVIFSQYAEQLAQEGKLDEAVEILKRGIQANPYHAPGYSVLAELLFQLESEEEAVEHLLSSIQLDPQMPRDLFRLGAYFRESEPDKGETYLQSARMYEPIEDESTLINESMHFSSSAGKGKTAVSVPDKDNAEAGEKNLPADDSDSAAIDRSSPEEDGEEPPSREPESGEEKVEVPDTGGMEQDQYPRQFNDRPVDSSEAVEIDSIEDEGKWQVFDAPIVQELDEELDFFDVISEYGKIPRDTEDLGEVFDIVNKDENMDVPVTENEGISDIRDITESEPEEENDAGGGLDEPVAPEEYEEYRPPAPEDTEAESANVLEIDEDEEYNLANFGFDTSSGEDIPVLSEEERFELMSFTDSEENRKKESPDTEPGTAGVSLEELEEIDEPAGESARIGENGYSDYLSDEEIEILSASVSDGDDPEIVSDAEDDFKDILSAWHPSGVSAGENAPSEDESSDSETEESAEPSIAAGPETEESDGLSTPAGVEFEAAAESEEAEEGNVSTVAEETEEFVISLGEPKKTLTEEENSLIRDFLADDGSLSAPDDDTPASPGNTQSEEPPKHGDALQEAIQADMPFYGYHLWFAEAPPSSAPPCRTAPPPDAAVAGGESLEDLISAYQNVLGSPELSAGLPVISETRPKTGAAHGPLPAEARPNPAGKGGSYTATMAEIYASQGLLARAIEIYEILIDDNPGNEKLRSRLAELKRLREHDTEAS